MKQYLAFYGGYYYPITGMGNFIGDYDTKEEAITEVRGKHLIENPEDDEWDYNFGIVWCSKERTNVFNSQD